MRLILVAILISTFAFMIFVYDLLGDGWRFYSNRIITSILSATYYLVLVKIFLGKQIEGRKWKE